MIFYIFKEVNSIVSPLLKDNIVLAFDSTLFKDNLLIIIVESTEENKLFPKFLEFIMLISFIKLKVLFKLKNTHSSQS